MHSTIDLSIMWENGCTVDPIRNKFLIPNIIRLLDAAKPASILDLGTGTGYVARVVDQGLSYKPEWTLVDIDQGRLSIAETKIHTGMKCQILNVDVMNHIFESTFTAVISTFTFLEIDDIDTLLEKLSTLIQSNGLFIVSIPDFWRDLIDYSATNPDIVRGFLEGPITIPKIDKFTNQAYPFRAMRIERLISQILALGFTLVELIESENQPNCTYLLTFRREGATR